jgi:hypothetical protein
MIMKRRLALICCAALFALISLWGVVSPAHAQTQKPNILFIMGDDGATVGELELV